MSITRPERGWNITRTPVHPGEMLREEFMKPLGISINGLALEAARIGHTGQRNCQRTPRNHGGYGIAVWRGTLARAPISG